MSDDTSHGVTNRDKLRALLIVSKYNPRFAALILAIGITSAVLEGVGLTFIIPIIELLQTSDPAANAEGLTQLFVTVYQTLGIPFTLGYVIGGVGLAMSLRYMSSFLFSWFRGILQLSYERHLRRQLFDNALRTDMQTLDQKGSDAVLNAILTEAKESANVLERVLKSLDVLLITTVYAVIALLISPLLTIGTVIFLGGITALLRSVLASGYELGGDVADANEQLQESVQAGMMGIRDVRVFNLTEEIYGKFSTALDQYTTSQITMNRNRTALNKLQNLIIAVFVFVLIYIALRFANLSFGELGLFLFVVFQLGPKVSALNRHFYRVGEHLPHMMRTQQFLADLTQAQEPDSGSRPVPSPVDTVSFENVSFSYDETETALDDVSFSVGRSEFVGFAGQSGAGKSTIVSLLARFYEPDSGRIYANGQPIDEMDPDEWRDRIAIVRQNPFIFNDTLRYNLTVGNREATRAEIDRACAIARVDEFLDSLPKGYDSQLGDDGVMLSGGQKQRVALARALLKDADLLILDEATSDLDSNLEKEVQREIESMDRDYAIIAIAHRLSTIRSADRIYIMEDGRISEKGDHHDLVERDGKYAELYSVQSAGP